MSRTAGCGRAEAKNRTELAREYLAFAQLAADETTHAAHNVAVGNAILASIAASDALCCLRLGVQSRGQDHRSAVDLLGRVDPALARDLDKLLQLKDAAHYGSRLLSTEKLTAALRSAQRLVAAAHEAIGSGP